MQSIENKRILLPCLFLLAIICFAGFGYVLAQSASNTAYLQSGVYPGGVTTVYTSGGSSPTYTVKTAYGAISYSGTNGSYAINLGVVPNGKELITSGVYYLDSSIIITSDDDGFSLQGQGRFNTFLFMEGDYLGTNAPIIYVKKVSNGATYQISISDLGLVTPGWGAGAYTSSALLLEGCIADCTFERLYIYSDLREGTGMRIKSTYSSNGNYYISGNTWRDIKIQNFYDSVVLERSGAGGIWENTFDRFWCQTPAHDAFNFVSSPATTVNSQIGGNNFYAITDAAETYSTAMFDMGSGGYYWHNSFYSSNYEDGYGMMARLNENCTGSSFMSCLPIFENDPQVGYARLWISGLPKSNVLIWGGGYVDGGNSGTQMTSQTFIPISDHPNTTHWGLNMTGAIWFDTTDKKIDYWNGTTIITP